jgi:hypothetical protein
MRKSTCKIKPRHKRVSEDLTARRARQAIEGAQAMAEHLNAECALRARTHRLRELRLARQNAEL